MKPINDTSNSMATHQLAYSAIANLKSRKWRRADVDEWLKGIKEPTQQKVRDKMNEVLKLTKPLPQAL
jgi:hypothetical protein